MRFFRGHTCSHHNESSQQVKLFPIPQLRLASSSLDTGTEEGNSRSQTGKQRLAEVIYPGRAERMGGKHPSLRAAVRSIQSNSNFLPVPLVWTGPHTLQRYAYWEYKPGGRDGGWRQTRPLGIVKSDCQLFYLTDQKRRLWPAPGPKQTAVSQLLDSSLGGRVLLTLARVS